MKAPRIICARDDLGKAIYGIIFKPISDKFFTLPQCIKHIAYRDRPKYIDELVGTDLEMSYVSIDYSSYESCQDADFMRMMEHRYYNTALAQTTFVRQALDDLLVPQVLTGQG